MLDILILVLIGRTSLRKIENSKTAQANAALICNIIEGKTANYDSLENPIGRFLNKLQQSVKLCATLTAMLCTLVFLVASELIFSMTNSALHLLQTVVADTSTYNFLATALIIIIAGTCLAACSFGCVGGLFLVGHLQRWQDARRTKRLGHRSHTKTLEGYPSPHNTPTPPHPQNTRRGGIKRRPPKPEERKHPK